MACITYILGTAKHFARNIWINKNYLGPEKLAKIEERLKTVLCRLDLGDCHHLLFQNSFLLHINGRTGQFIFLFIA